MPNYAIYVAAKCMALLLDVVIFAMMIRAIMSWVMPDRSSRFFQIVYGLTEPVIAPIRQLLSRFAFFRSSPIDLSFLIAYLILEIIRSMLVV